MPSENRAKHLEFVQGIISRMSTNSFLLKAWAVTLVAGLFALAAKDANPKYVFVAYLPIVVFWGIDAYFLSKERSFRGLYDHVRVKPDDEIDFSMDITPFQKSGNTWSASLVSGTLLFFYLSLLLIIVGVTFWIKLP